MRLTLDVVSVSNKTAAEGFEQPGWVGLFADLRRKAAGVNAYARQMRAGAVG